MAVVPLPPRSLRPPRGEWLPDARDGDRALRVSWHAELGCVVLSTWRGDSCVGTVRLANDENGMPRSGSNRSTAFSVPSMAIWTRSSSSTPRPR